MEHTLTLDARHFAPAPLVFKQSARFTRDGSDELERFLERICSKVLASVRRIIPSSRLRGIALGGGYGRGEGGVLKTTEDDQPYNDLEFYIFVRGPVWLNERLYRNALHHTSEELSRMACIEVEFKLTSTVKLRRASPSMFYYDLALGHCWLLGDDSLLDGCEHHRHARNIPHSEAIRLLMNRCSGLLLAREKLKHENFTAEDADFVCRNIAKAKLALGDAVLVMFGQYHWSCVERHRRLRELFTKENLPWLRSVVEQHGAGAEFKLHPYLAVVERAELEKEHRKIARLATQVWLWVESRRLSRNFHSLNQYAACSSNKFPETEPWRNWLLNLKTFGRAGILRPRALRHPRERVLNTLAMLLSDENHNDVLQFVSNELLLNRSFFGSVVDLYRSRWARIS